jgi:hypothetical protein
MTLRSADPAFAGKPEPSTTRVTFLAQPGPTKTSLSESLLYLL